MDCKSDSEIDKFLRSVFFELRIWRSEILINEHATQETVVKNQFFSQFQGDLSQYIDNNNELIRNTVISRNERVKIWNEPIKSEYLSVKTGLGWFGHNNTEEFLIVQPDNSTKIQTRQILWGQYFFVGETLVNNYHSVKTILDCLSEVGGLMSIIMAAITVVFR